METTLMILGVIKVLETYCWAAEHVSVFVVVS